MNVNELKEALRLKRMERDGIEAHLRGLERKLPTVAYELAMLEEQLALVEAGSDPRLTPCPHCGRRHPFVEPGCAKDVED